jgi:hypothetical protein
MKVKHLELLNSAVFPCENSISVKDLGVAIIEYIATCFFNTLLHRQRTVIDEILREEHLFNSFGVIGKRLKGIDLEICEMNQKGEIILQVKDVKKDAHFILLIK